MLQDGRVVEIGFEVQFLQCPVMVFMKVEIFTIVQGRDIVGGL